MGVDSISFHDVPPIPTSLSSLAPPSLSSLLSTPLFSLPPSLPPPRYIQEDILKSSDPNYRQFRKIFESFRISEEEPVSADPASMSVSELVAQAAEKSKQMSLQQKQDSSSDEEAEKERNEEEQQKISKKKLRKLNRLSVAQLKQLVERPDVVEMHDVTATDPKLLIHLKVRVFPLLGVLHWVFSLGCSPLGLPLRCSPLGLPWVFSLGVLPLVFCLPWVFSFRSTP